MTTHTTTYPPPAARAMAGIGNGSIRSLQVEIERLQAENEALTTWGREALGNLIHAVVWLPDIMQDVTKEFCDNAPDCVKGDEGKK